MRVKLFFIMIGLLILRTSPVSAAVTILDKDDWKFLIGGFVETDVITDSVRSYTEVVGNKPVDKTGLNNVFGRTQFSVRNSRLAFTILPPIQDDWKTKGYLELDLMGYDPDASATAPTNSESGFYTNPTMRVRHAYLSGENNGWTLLSGQYWSLFGWQTKYILTTVSIAPVPGYIYERTPQVMGLKSIALGDSSILEIAISAERPAQRDSATPNLVAAAKWSYSGISSGISTYVGETNVAPLSIGVSATTRQFETADTSTSPTGLVKTTAQAVSIDALIPIIPSSDGKDSSNTLTLTGEFSSGKGYADGLSGWSGNLPQFPSGSNNEGSTNLDAGQGGFDSTDTFGLVQLQAWSLQLQYQFAADLHMFANIGYGTLSSSNVGNYTSSKAIYDSTSVSYINLFKDLTKQIRVAGEYDRFTTHYFADGSTASDNRYQASAYFRF